MINQQIQKVLYFIENNLNNQLDLDDLARIAGYSKYHFSRCFKLNVGESVIDYMTRLRLEKSQFKIIQNNSMINVALDIGYETPNGFNKAFKKIFGTTPTKYKKLKKDFLNQYKELGIYLDNSVKIVDNEFHTSCELDIIHKNPMDNSIEVTECKQYNGSNIYAAKDLLGTDTQYPRPKDQNLLQCVKYLLTLQKYNIQKINLLYLLFISL